VPLKQKDKCPSLEELKAATTATIGILRFTTTILDTRNVSPQLRKKLQDLKEKAATLIGLLRREIIAEQELLQLQLEQIDEVFKCSGGRT